MLRLVNEHFELRLIKSILSVLVQSIYENRDDHQPMTSRVADPMAGQFDWRLLRLRREIEQVDASQTAQHRGNFCFFRPVEPHLF